ncbi:MAG: DNA-3-methyladenine glycosylase [Solirubrobacterales bacterium]|jgi:DNA-3-methyladenine glycosylase|nr:DNA-3-methyladenine glycosylase [Solirubrobacterales bacterium]
MSGTPSAATSAAGPALGPALGPEFFRRSVHRVAPDLIGATLLVGGVGGVIVETESYDGDDPACHGYGGPTERNATIFGPAGRAYVYLSYGIHCLLNFVCEREGRAAAVLIRALEPAAGIEAMRARRCREPLPELCSGPGKLGEALDIGLDLDGASLFEPPFELYERPGGLEIEVASGPRIGISKATERPWRYCAVGTPHLSRPLVTG